MSQTYTLTEAKAKLSELISRVHFGNEKLTITRKGKAVAVVSPINETAGDEQKEGLILAKGSLQEFDEAVDELVSRAYKNRENATDRKVDL